MFVFSGNDVGNRDITVGDFADIARSTISHTSLSDGMLLVPTWEIIWSGLFCITGLI